MSNYLHRICMLISVVCIMMCILLKRNIMTRLGKILIPALFFYGGIMFLSCSNESNNDIPSSKDFWVINMTNSNYATDESAWYIVHGIRRLVTANCAIFCDQNVTVSDSEILALASQFEGKINPLVGSYFSTPIDVDSNDKVYILLLDIIDGYSGTSYMGGYFWDTDFYPATTIAKYNILNGTVIKTNSCEVLYVDVNPQNISSETAWRTVAHEFQHLVNSSYRLSHDYVRHDTWIDEGLAEAAAHLCYGKSDDRLYVYETSYRTTVSSGHPLFYWYPVSDQKVLVNYALSYLYFQFLRGQSSAKQGIFNNIIQSPYGDYRAAEYAIALDPGLSSHGSGASDSFNKLLLRWYATNAGVTGSLYGYDSEIGTVTAPGEYSGGLSAYLRSGAGVYKQGMGTSYTSSSSDYIYLSVNSPVASATDEDFDSPYSSSEYLIAVNKTYTPSSSVTTETSLPASINSTQDAETTSSASGVSAGRSSPGSPVVVDFIPSRLSLPDQDFCASSGEGR